MCFREVCIRIKNSFHIYPNPSSSILHIDGIQLNSITEINILDLSGHIVYSEQKQVNTLRVEHLTKGLYFIQVNMGDKRYTSKFIKE